MINLHACIYFVASIVLFSSPHIKQFVVLNIISTTSGVSSPIFAMAFSTPAKGFSSSSESVSFTMYMFTRSGSIPRAAASPAQRFFIPSCPSPAKYITGPCFSIFCPCHSSMSSHATANAISRATNPFPLPLGANIITIPSLGSHSSISHEFLQEGLTNSLKLSLDNIPNSRAFCSYFIRCSESRASFSFVRKVSPAFLSPYFNA